MSYGKWMILVALAAMVLSSLACTDSKGGVADLVKPTPSSELPNPAPMELPDPAPAEELPNPTVEQLKENWEYNTGELEDTLESLDFETLCPVVSEIVRKAEAGEYAEEALNGLIDGQNTIKSVARRCFELGDSLQEAVESGEYEKN